MHIQKRDLIAFAKSAVIGVNQVEPYLARNAH
jgi:hypothetical protein